MYRTDTGSLPITHLSFGCEMGVFKDKNSRRTEMGGGGGDGEGGEKGGGGVDSS